MVRHDRARTNPKLPIYGIPLGKQRCENLLLVLRQTGRREEKHLAFVNQAGVAEVWIRMGDAGPGRAAVQLCLRDAPQRIAEAHDVLGGSAWRSDRSGHDNFGTYFEETGVAQTGIESQQLLPAIPIAEAGGSKLPKRVSVPDNDDHHFSRDSW